MSDILPNSIERWCCPGKSCGNTELELISSGRNTYPGLYNYVRVSNRSDYSGWKTEQQMVRWLEETKDHIQEEMDPGLPIELYDVSVPYPIAQYDPEREFEVWEIYKGDIPVGKVTLTFSDGEGIGTEDQNEYFNAQAEVATDDIPEEFLEKHQKLAAFLLNLATGLSWDDEDSVELHGNYFADADDILRSNPHLLGLSTRESMRLDDND